MRTFNKILSTVLISAAAQQSMAADLDIEVQNLTQGIFFTPLIVVAHTEDTSLFELGEAASPELEAMAEGGDISGLETIGSSINANMVSNPAGGLLFPGTSVMTQLTTDESNTVLSLVGMLLPSNDAFVGLDNWAIPTEAGTYTFYLNGYDAGTEANDELRASMPVPPPLEPLLGMSGTGVTDVISNPTVHIHPGNIGDDQPTAGNSDMSNSVHRWLNPIARVTVTVN